MFKNSFFATVCTFLVQFSCAFASKLPVVFKRRSTNIACKPLQLVKFSFDVLFQWSSSFFLRGGFSFLCVSERFCYKAIFSNFPVKFSAFLPLSFFFIVLVVSLRCPVCLTLQIFIVHCPLQQQPFVFVLFPHFRFLCFQQVLTQAFARFIDQVALT